MAKPYLLALAAGLLLALWAPTTARANDIVADFSNTSNPNGVWSYYQNGALYTYPSESGTISGQPAWGTQLAGAGVPDAISIIQNTSGGLVGPISGSIFIPNGYLNLDPEGFSVAVVFTAPAAGTYSINGNFYGDDTGQNAHPVEILYNGTTVLFTNTISSYQQMESFGLVSKFLNAGDTLTFLVGTGSTGCTYCNLSTGLQGTVTLNSSPVPEPGTLLLMGSGLAAICSRFGRRKNA